MTKAFDKLRAGLEDAIAFAKSDETKAIVHTPEQIMARKKARHKQRAGREIVSRKTDEVR